MILADKIINERKKNGWSQEELAEKLSVSRQSVSKWEGAQAVPDLQKIIAMADIFGVSTDYLLKDEMELDSIPMTTPTTVDSTSDSSIRRVSLEEANEFVDLSRKNAPKIANGVSLCILSPVVLILLAGLSDNPAIGLSANVASAIGLIVLLALVAFAVYIFILFGSYTKKFEYIEKEQIETAYGVTGMAQERKKAMEGRRTSHIAIGVILCICCSLPLLVTSCLELDDFIIISMVCVLLIIVSIAVNLFVRVGIEWESYNKLLQEGDYRIRNKKSNKLVEGVSGIYWSITLAIYLGWSFVTMQWEFTWIVWPVAAVLFGAISCITRLATHADTID